MTAKRKGQKKWMVTYSGTRHFNTYGTKREAISQAGYALGIGNREVCIHKLESIYYATRSRGVPMWRKVRCMRRK